MIELGLRDRSLKSVFFCCQRVGRAIYATAKGGVHQLTKAFALELGPMAVGPFTELIRSPALPQSSGDMEGNDQMELQPIALSTIPDAIIQQIRGLIAGGQLKPGDRLPNERDLGEQFGVGRSSVREALMALAAMGLVVRTREGTFVNRDSTRLVWLTLDQGTALTRATIRDVFETRRLFEVGIAALAAERRTSESLAEIRRWVADSVEDVETFKRADVNFHLAIARAAGNPFVFELYGKVQEILFQTHQYYTALERLDPQTSAAMYDAIICQHKAILTAIENGDPAAAQAAMLAHFTALEENMLQGPVTVLESPEEDSQV